LKEGKDTWGRKEAAPVGDVLKRAGERAQNQSTPLKKMVATVRKKSGGTEGGGHEIKTAMAGNRANK